MSLTFADGQLGASSGTILGVDPAGQHRTVNLVLTNTSSSNTQTVVLTVTRGSGTARRVARLVLSPNESAYLANLPLAAADVLAGSTTDASTVDYVTSQSPGGPFSVTCLDANGALRSGSGGLSGALTLSSDLTLKNAGGVSHEAWDASDVEALWANAPSRLEPDYHARCFEIFDDFLNPASATASDLMAWTSVDDSATGTNAFQDAAGGVYNVVTAGVDNDYHAMASVNEVFKFVAGKKLWFEARFKLAEANTNESAWWFGLTDTLTTGGFQADAGGPLASYDGALIWKDEATLTIDFETSNAGTQATTSAFATFASDTWTRVGFYFDGTATTSTITPYADVDGTGLVAGTAQEITLAGLEEMHLVFGVKAGPSAGAETLQVDYIRCVQLR